MKSCGIGMRVVTALAVMGMGAGSAMAAEPVMVAPVVRYEASVGTPNVRNECDWNRTIVDTLVERSKGRVVVAGGPLDLNRGTTLDLWIHEVHAVGGGGFAGPSWGVLRGELRQNGKVVGRFEQKKQTMSRLKFKACSALAKVGGALGHFAANWLVASPQEKAKFFYGPPLDVALGATATGR